MSTNKKVVFWNLDQFLLADMTKKVVKYFTCDNFDGLDVKLHSQSMQGN